MRAYREPISEASWRLLGRGAVRGAVLAAVILWHPGVSMAQCITGDCVNGTGSIRYPSGSRYSGEFSGGVKHGLGTFLWLDGREFRGHFAYDIPQGTGVLTMADGREKIVVFEKGVVVSFSWRSQEAFHGDCRYGSSAGRHDYSGWHRGNEREGIVPHGRGRMRYRNGSVYEGQWEDGRMHGNGVIRWDDGSSYIGEWRRGKRCGFGIYRWSDGRIYAGGWEDNNMSGFGIMRYPDGRERAGEWREGSLLSRGKTGD
ncbi:MAG: hypothetical protein JXA20_11160 [Spirochaetes bacterium]|nr:hypothetical protein [Spirochaetota bacterium]